MARIISMRPDSGAPGDIISIDVEYDQQPDNEPPAVRYVFFENVMAPRSLVTMIDRESRTLTVEAEIPNGARNGRLHVDFEGLPTVESDQDFTITHHTDIHLRVLNVMPIMPAQGYQRLTVIRINFADPILHLDEPSILFPRADYGPPSLSSQGRAVLGPASVTARIPQGAHTGRLKVSFKEQQTPAAEVFVLTPVLKFCD